MGFLTSKYIISLIGFVVRQWYPTTTMLYLWAIFFLKMSILLLYFRLFSVRHKARMVIRCLMGLVVLSTLSAFFLYLFGCRPISALWNPFVKGRCLGRSVILIPPGAVNLFTDICTVIIPCPLVWQLKLPTREKIGVIVVLVLGSMWVLMFFTAFSN